MTTKAERETALTELRALCPPGTTVYTILRSVSRSGMSRRISLFVLRGGKPQNITMRTGEALGYNVVNVEGQGTWAVKIGGCGMDMGFHLVNSLSYALHGTQQLPGPDGFRPGYTLTHRWL